MSKLIIDCSVLWYSNWHRMKSADYQATSNIELVEFAKNLTSNLHEYITRFKPDEIIFGIDSKEWRTPYFSQYFKDRTHYWKSKTEKNSWVMKVGQVIHIIKMGETTGTWTYKKASKAEELLLDLTDSTGEKWVFFEKGQTPAYILEAYPDTFKTVQECPDWPALETKAITYKGGRNANWPYKTPYAEFKKCAKSITYNLAALFGAKAVAADWSEFDDIAHAYIKDNAGQDEIILVTTDQDLDQLQALHPKLKIWCPGGGPNFPAAWVVMEPLTAQYHLWCKLIGGDSSDKIPGVTLKDITYKGRGENKREVVKLTTYPTVSWETKLICKGGKATDKFVMKLTCGHLHPDEKVITPQLINKYLKDHEVDGTYSRNVALMHLSAAPVEIQNNCRAALAAATIDTPIYTLADYMIDETEKRTIEHRALIKRKKDLEDGIYSPLDQNELLRLTNAGVEEVVQPQAPAADQVAYNVPE